MFAACAQSSTYVTTCNCILFECFSVDRWKSIRPVVWTRIDWCVFDDNENAYFWKRAHLCVYGAKTQTVRPLRVFKSRRRKPLSSYCNRNRSCKRLETWHRLQFPEGKITRAHMYALAHRHKQLILIKAWKRAFWTESNYSAFLFVAYRVIVSRNLWCMGSSFIRWIDGRVSSTDWCDRFDNNRDIPLRSTYRYFGSLWQDFSHS